MAKRKRFSGRIPHIGKKIERDPEKILLFFINSGTKMYLHAKIRTSVRDAGKVWAATKKSGGKIKGLGLFLGCTPVCALQIYTSSRNKEPYKPPETLPITNKNAKNFHF